MHTGFYTWGTIIIIFSPYQMLPGIAPVLVHANQSLRHQTYPWPKYFRLCFSLWFTASQCSGCRFFSHMSSFLCISFLPPWFQFPWVLNPCHHFSKWTIIIKHAESSPLPHYVRLKFSKDAVSSISILLLWGWETGGTFSGQGPEKSCNAYTAPLEEGFR